MTDTQIDYTDEDEYVITDGSDLEQDGEATGGGDWAYPLTAFVPKCDVASDSRQIPAEAATWIIPDVEAGKIFRIRKIFKTTWLEKVPASYNMLFVKVVNKKPEPTPWQRALIDASVSRYDDPEKGPRVGQSVLLPIINIYKGEATPVLAEFGVTFYKELKKKVLDAEEDSDGKITTKTHAFRVWRAGTKDYGIKADKSNKWNVAAITEDAVMIDPTAYAKERAIATEQWWLDKWREFRTGEATTFSGGASREERISAAMEHIPTTRLKSVLVAAGLEVTSGSRPRLVDLVMDNIDKVESSILTVAATFGDTSQDQAAQEPPF